LSLRVRQFGRCVPFLVGVVACGADPRRPAPPIAPGPAVAPACPAPAARVQAPTVASDLPTPPIAVEERRVPDRSRTIAFDPWRKPSELATSQPSPCVFAGTLRLEYDVLFSDAEAKHPALKAVRLDLSALTLPAKLGGAVRVDAVWPLRGTFWLAPAFLPLQLVSPRDLVPGHVWLPAATTVTAAAPRGENAQVERPAARPGDRKSSPAFNELLPCSELMLVGQLAPGDGDEPPDSARFAGHVSLSARPNEPQIGALELPISTELGVWETDGAWTRITGLPDEYRDGTTSYVPYAFDAWTRSKPVSTDRIGTGGLMFVGKPTHIVTAELQVLTGPAPGKPIAVLPVDLVFGVGPARNGFVSIDVPGIYPATQAGKLWVSEAELSRSARPLPDESIAQDEQAPPIGDMP
jgi:hypothetical protein